MEHIANHPFHLTSNQLKLIALISMTIDHVGLYLLPQYRILRIIGRLAFPIFAYMIAEGCRYTAHPIRYLGTVFSIGAAYQGFCLLAMESRHMNILLTFSLSIALIYAIRWGQTEKGLRWLPGAGVFLLAAFLCEGLPMLLPGTGYAVDYGFAGVLLPVFVFLGNGKWEKLVGTAVGLVFVALYYGGIQWFCLLTLPLLACYHGERGKWKLKYLFYIYYPLHLVVIWGIGLLLNGT